MFQRLRKLLEICITKKQYFFQSNSFINNCKNIYHNNKSKIYIIVLKENNEPILVAPLYIQKIYNKDT